MTINQLPPHLKVVGVKKSFGSVEAIRYIDFEVRSGEVMGLVGDNGAGKSTLMKIIAGAETSDEGEFFLKGNEIKISNPLDATRQGIRIVYQDLALCENLDVSANLFLGQETTLGGWFKFIPNILRPLNSLEMESNAQKAINKLQVKTLKSVQSRVGVLSGGQRQAIAIARAMGTDASVILLDEPTAALGVTQTKEVLEVIKQLKKTNHAVVYISHNLNDVFEVCDRITVLRQGVNIGIYETNFITSDRIVAAMTKGFEGDV